MEWTVWSSCTDSVSSPHLKNWYKIIIDFLYLGTSTFQAAKMTPSYLGDKHCAKITGIPFSKPQIKPKKINNSRQFPQVASKLLVFFLKCKRARKASIPSYTSCVFGVIQLCAITPARQYCQLLVPGTSSGRQEITYESSSHFLPPANYLRTGNCTEISTEKRDLQISQ